jgi:PAS domain S-box-containing protein
MEHADLRYVFETGVEADLLLDESARVVLVSDGYLRAVAGRRDAVIGRSLFDLPPYADDEPLSAALRAHLDAVLHSKVFHANELQHADPSRLGSRFTWAINRPVCRDDHGTCFIVHSLRIGERGAETMSDRERRLRKLIEHTYDTIALFDAQGRPLFVSPSIRALLGISEAEFLEQVFTRVHPEDAEAFGAQIRTLLSEPGSLRLLRFRGRSGDGCYRWIECAVRNLLHDPDVSAVVANFHDVTEHVELEAELRRINEDLRRASLERERLYLREQQANRTKDEFLAMLGHELRNPLSPILTALELMRMKEPVALEKERTIVERQVQHLVGLVDDLLDVSRITRGKVELRKRRLELSAAVTKAIEMTSPLLEQRQHDLRIDVPERGLEVYGDEVRLAQVVANLLNNAAKYTAPRGSIAIEARVREHDAVLTVRDSGRGIPHALLSRLFDQFVQGEQTPDRSEGGLGLGLAIVRSLVELHGGTVEADSAGPGQGSSFTVTLPLASASSQRETGRVRAPDFAGASQQFAGRRVLVVDDNRDAADLLVQLLRAVGCEARPALDAPEALSVALQFRPELALIDIGLPVMDGYELARRMQTQPNLRDIKLVAITGYGQPRDRERSAAAGFIEHLVKPVPIERVLEVTARVLRAPVAAPQAGAHGG